MQPHTAETTAIGESFNDNALSKISANISISELISSLDQPLLQVL